MHKVTSTGIARAIRKVLSSNLLQAHPVVAMGALRLLDEEATKLVFSLLAATIHISRLGDVDSARESLTVLDQMKMVSCCDGFVSLSPRFRKALLAGLLGTSEEVLLKEERDSEPPPALKSTEMDSVKSQAVEESKRKFQHLLNLIVNRAAEKDQKMKSFLVSAGLIDDYDNITNSGFEFLLQSRSDQQWSLLLFGLKHIARNDEEEERMLFMLMEVCLKCRISVCRVEEWSEWHDFLDRTGVIHCFETHNNQRRIVVINEHFFARSSTYSGKERYLVLETNFKIYAYTSRLYEKSILDLFSRTVYVLPNLIKAQFDEQSIVNAFKKGITANQIIRYLKDHSENLPQNVENQLKIWERGLRRIKKTSAVLFTGFNHLSDYDRFCRMLEDKSALLYSNDRQRIVIADERVYEEAREFLRDLKS